MRSNYERCLLDFEHYMRVPGAYDADRRAGRLPTPSHQAMVLAQAQAAGVAHTGLGGAGIGLNLGKPPLPAGPLGLRGLQGTGLANLGGLQLGGQLGGYMLAGGHQMGGLGLQGGLSGWQLQQLGVQGAAGGAAAAGGLDPQQQLMSQLLLNASSTGQGGHVLLTGAQQQLLQQALLQQQLLGQLPAGAAGLGGNVYQLQLGSQVPGAAGGPVPMQMEAVNLLQQQLQQQQQQQQIAQLQQQIKLQQLHQQQLAVSGAVPVTPAAAAGAMAVGGGGGQLPAAPELQLGVSSGIAPAAAAASGATALGGLGVGGLGAPAGAASAGGGAGGYGARPVSNAIGTAFTALGESLVGQKLWRYWPDEGGWYEAVVTSYDPLSREHVLLYEGGTENESTEDVVLSSLDDIELRQTPPEGLGRPPPPPPPPPQQHHQQQQPMALQLQLNQGMGAPPVPPAAGPALAAAPGGLGFGAATPLGPAAGGPGGMLSAAPGVVGGVGGLSRPAGIGEQSLLPSELPPLSGLGLAVPGGGFQATGVIPPVGLNLAGPSLKGFPMQAPAAALGLQGELEAVAPAAAAGGLQGGLEALPPAAAAPGSAPAAAQVAVEPLVPPSAAPPLAAPAISGTGDLPPQQQAVAGGGGILGQGPTELVADAAVLPPSAAATGAGAGMLVGSQPLPSAPVAAATAGFGAPQGLVLAGVAPLEVGGPGAQPPPPAVAAAPLAAAAALPAAAVAPGNAQAERVRRISAEEALAGTGSRNFTDLLAGLEEEEAAAAAAALQQQQAGDAAE